MALIIRDNNADFSNHPDAKKYYSDARVSEGTLLLLDFSRKSTLPTGTLKNNDKVNDLAKGASSLNNSTSFLVTSNINKDLDFLVNGSYLLKNTSASLDGNTGINLLQNIQNYLATKNVQRALLILWIFNESSSFNTTTALSSKTSESIGNGFIIRASVQSTGAVVVTMGGAQTNPIQIGNPEGKFTQIAVIYNQGSPLIAYKNNALIGNSGNNAGGWGIPSNNMIVGQNSGSDGNLTTAKLGSVMLEDLDKSGRNAVDVIRRDYEYVNGIGEFEGIEKRPYANL